MRPSGPSPGRPSRTSTGSLPEPTHLKAMPQDTSRSDLRREQPPEGSAASEGSPPPWRRQSAAGGRPGKGSWHAGARCHPWTRGGGHWLRRRAGPGPPSCAPAGHPRWQRPPGCGAAPAWAGAGSGCTCARGLKRVRRRSRSVVC